MTATPRVPPEEIGALRDGDLQLEFVAYAMHPVHKVPAYQFRMVDCQGAELGTINLRAESTRHVERYAGHVGFAVHPEARGQRYAARALRLLVPLASQLGIDPVWITCDPENTASRRSLEHSGAELVEIIDVPPDCIIARSGHPRKCRFRLPISNFAKPLQAEDSI